MGLGKHCRDAYFTATPKERAHSQLPGAGANRWFRNAIAAFDEADIVGVDVTEELQFLKLYDGMAPPQNLQELCSFACRQMQRKTRGAPARGGSQLVVVMLDGKRRAMMKDVEAAKRRKGRVGLAVTAMDGDPDGTQDANGDEFLLPWAKLTPPNPMGKDAERAYLSLNVMGRVRKFTAGVLHREGPYKLQLNRQTQRLLVVADEGGSTDSVTYWDYGEKAGRWQKHIVGGVRDGDSCDGEADVLWPLVLTSLLRQPAVFGLRTDSLHLATFSVDTDWVAIGAVWFAARAFTLRGTECADTEIELRWNKRAVQGKARGVLSCFDVHALVADVCELAQCETAEQRLQSVANEVCGWISVAGCDFVEQADMRKGRKIGFAAMARQVSTAAPLQIMHVAPARAMWDDDGKLDECLEPLLSDGATLSLIVALESTAALEFSVDGCGKRAREGGQPRPKKVRGLPTEYAIAQSGGNVAIRNAAATVVYWLAAALGALALKTVVPHRATAPVHQLLMGGFAPTDYNADDSESDAGVGPHKRRVLRWATEAEVLNPEIPRAAWVLPLI